MKKILVTGGAGFIGSHLVDKLIEKKYKVAIIDDFSGGSIKNCNKKAKVFKIDIRDFKKTENAISSFKPEIVYHLAANAAENKAQFSPVDITSRNFDGSIKVLTASIRSGVKKFVFTSSIAVYGSLQTPFKEKDKAEPEDLYGISKLAFEDSLKILSKVHKFKYVIARPHNVYGPRQNMQDPYRNVVTIFMNSILQNKPFYIYGKGDQRRCFSYIDDVVEALVKCGSKKINDMTFNIGSDNDFSVKELSDSILKITKSGLKPINLPERPQEVKIAISDHKLSKKYLNYRDKTTLEKGLTKTWVWVQSEGYKKPKFDTVEIDSPLLPKNWK
ncbi:MAG: NAD-dependent epimerase/dehydratase family protein [Candidatus Levybacteria bacterium]|nr:NAD-dependent epimerase/dehydratase family protein [Candidatus Levybacteria bacterium]